MLALLTLLLVQSSRPSPAAPPRVELVESAPLETTLDHAHLRNADAVWRELIDGATTRLDFAWFYASDLAERRTALAPIVEAIERAAARGVPVRFLSEKKFQKTYPDTLARLGRAANVTVRILDLEPLTGGVLHAKYFLVDDAVTFVGSQNFDWRSLEHIQELGACVRSKEVSAAFRAVFEADWGLAGGAPRDAAMTTLAKAFAGLPRGEGAWGAVTPVFSPRELLPDDTLWDLPRILALIDGARRSVRVQLLTYAMTSRDGYFAELENALRRAAARGVRVQLLLADWCMRKGTIEGLQSLEPLPGIDVKLVTIPAFSGGFIPYARVCHAKYLVVDGSAAWLGTSNWEWSYFHRSRNAGLLLSGEVARTLDELFAELWRSGYAQPVDPARVYVAPRIAESAPASQPAPAAQAPGRGAFAVGDQVPQDVVVEDAAGQEHPLLGLAGADTKVLVVFLFGGGEGKPVARRGGLWCEDSLADLPLLRHVQARFGRQGVQVIPVACPPVFHEERFGFTKGAFGPPVRAEDRAVFVAATMRVRDSGVLPFAQVWFDPRLRLLGRRESASVWEGRFRADGETQTYGTPTLWLLSRTGEVLCPPFFGNNHEQEKALAYTAREVDAAIAAALAR